MKKILFVLPLLVVFMATFYHPSSLDLGWHLRFGKDLIQNHTFSYTNTYSQELPGFKWFNSSWGLDILTYEIFSHWGFLGLALAGSITAVLTFAVLAYGLRLSLFTQSLLFPLLLWIHNPVFVESFKGQEVSFLFLALLIAILWKYQQKSSKTIWLLVPLFFLWANLHAQFIVGLVFLAVWSACILVANKTGRSKKHYAPVVISTVCILSVCVTLINPYGLGLYTESFAHTGSDSLKYITEFQPPVLFSETWWKLILWSVAVAISTVLAWRKKTLTVFAPYLLCTTVLLVLSFLVRRYIGPMVIISLAPVALMLQSRLSKPGRIATVLASCLCLVAIAYITLVLIPKGHLTRFDWISYCRIMRCSIPAAETLIRMPKTGKVLTHYDYGGWLIYNYPELKPTLDGRMTLWEDSHGQNPFQSFIDTLFWNGKKIEHGPFDTYFIPTNTLLANKLYYLSSKNTVWKIVYRDPATSIYTRMQY